MEKKGILKKCKVCGGIYMDGVCNCDCDDD